VPLLAAQTDLDQRAFLLEGDENVGAKQTSIFNRGMMPARRTLTEIPVPCVAAERRNRRSAQFASSGRTQCYAGRACKMGLLGLSVAIKKGASSDHHQVWDEIAQAIRRMSSGLRTLVMADILQQRAASPELDTDASKPIRGGCWRRVHHRQPDRRQGGL